MNSVNGLLSFFVASFAASVVSAADFTGPRIEAHGGYDRVSLDLDYLGLGSGHQDGAVYGIGLGYDFPITPSITIGAEVNGDLSSTKACFRDGTERGCIRARRDLSTLVRIGSKIGDNTLFYVKAGYSNTRLKVTYTDSDFPADNFTVAGNGDGIRGGVGTEFALGSRTYAKVEYDYTNYEAGFSRNQALVGIGVRF